MSRAVKDLRSIINVSRLSIRCSDDEEFSDTKSSPLCSPDSGIICTPGSRPSSTESLEKTLRSSIKPLPNICIKNNDLPYNDKIDRNINTPLTMQSNEGDFEHLLTYIDSLIVSNWLQKANEFLDQLCNWYHIKENFISFVNFWLTFPDQSRINLHKSEYEILFTEISEAFSTGIQNGKIIRRHIRLFLHAVYREYPDKLLCSHGKQLFLNQLSVLSCNKEEEYRHLLSDVKCKSNIKQHAQWILAVRAYCIISVSHAIISFFNGATQQPQLSDCASNLSFNEINFQEHNILYAISHGFVEAVQYLLKNGEMNIDWKDEQNKTLMFHAVISQQPKVLSYLLRQTEDPELINAHADNGNTILHAVINTERLDLLEIILNCPLIDVNCHNSLGFNVAPIHVAIVFEHKVAIEMLLAKNANWKLLWNGKTPRQLAEETKNQDIIQIFLNLEN